MQSFDIVILGGGPGGTTAARILAQAGRSVALVEKTHLGGTCLNCGCIPTKMLLGAVAPLALLHAQQRTRVAKGEIAVDFAALQTRVSRFTSGTSKTLGKSLASMGVTIFTGRGEGIAPGTVRVHAKDGTTDLTAQHILLACGSSSAAFPGLTPDHDCVLDSTDLLGIESVPESLVIIGAGAIGLELGDFFSAMGSKVTIVEAAPHIAPLEDTDIAAELRRALQKNGITCHEGARAKDLRTVDGQAQLTLEDGTVISAAKALVAVGRTPNTAGLNAQQWGCNLNKRGYVETNAFLEAAPNVYAVGDVNGLVLLAHAAEHQAVYVAERILGESAEEYQSGPVPSCVYGAMEVMRVGQTAEALLREGKNVEVSQAALSLNPIAQASGGTAGFVKTVWSDGKIAGIAAVGAGVSHLVMVALLLIKEGYTAQNLHKVMFAHPTLDEIVSMSIMAPRVRVESN
ncbi:FAD-dependent oxidoreductase [uncultured Desulfovibrio sp.]|uniref:dihydrolipoyl dehydrogenase family protein n=1 Tax=uncultured Desulfovibrio sp. TaxID=167968 RepID=UPI00261A77AB|nr:FAD-dependent oxidoreductase [uncultured Desulfovibrio sp.]